MNVGSGPEADAKESSPPMFRALRSRCIVVLQARDDRGTGLDMVSPLLASRVRSSRRRCRGGIPLNASHKLSRCEPLGPCNCHNQNIFLQFMACSRFARVHNGPCVGARCRS